jgi:hypothetical protein
MGFERESERAREREERRTEREDHTGLSDPANAIS